MSELSDSETVIKSSPPGTMIYGRVKQSLDAPWQTVFYIREDKQYLRWLTPNPIVEMRAGVEQVDNVFLVPLMVKVGGETYESWLNYHATGGHGAGGLQDLAIQEQNFLLFFGDSGERERSIGFRNSCKKTFALILEGIKNKSAWSMQDFNQAREQLYKKYPTLQKLWASLSGN